MNKHCKKLRRRGITMVYVILTLPVMVALCSLAVDLGRVQAAKTSLRYAVDAAARAGAIALPQGSSSAQSEAISIAARNTVDGTPLALTAANVLIGSWNTSTHTFVNGGGADGVTTYWAVQVSAARSSANGNGIPLMFGAIIGASTCKVSATTVVAIITQPSSTTAYVSSHGNPWLAGQPAGTTASEPDPSYNNPSNSAHPWKQDVANPAKVLAAVNAAGSSGTYNTPTDSSRVYSSDYSANEPYGSPTGFVLNVVPGSSVQISIPLTSQNMVNNQGYTGGGTGSTYADGNSAGYYTNVSDDAANPTFAQGTTTTSGTEHGLSNVIVPLNAVVGVFMDKNGATHGADSSQETNEASAPPTPPGLDFSTQSARDYSQISPKLNQPFYVGNGQTSSGVLQTIVIPPNVYELFLGTMDGHEWSNNLGGYNTTMTQFKNQTVQ